MLAEKRQSMDDVTNHAPATATGRENPTAADSGVASPMSMRGT